MEHDGRWLDSAVGFVVDAEQGLVITARHCAYGAYGARVNLGGKGLLEVTGIAAEDDKEDVVILRCTNSGILTRGAECALGLPGHGTPAAIMFRDEVGGLGTEYGWTQEPELASYANAVVVNTTIMAWHGLSGAPLIRDDGRVIGMITTVTRLSMSNPVGYGGAASCDAIRRVMMRVGDAATDKKMGEWVVDAARLREARMLLATASRNAETNPELAETLFRKALDVQPNHFDTLTRYCAFLEARGEGVAACARCRSFADNNPGDPRPWLQIAYLHQSSGRYKEAEDAFQRAFKIDAGSAVAVYWSGVLKSNDGKWEEAAQDLEASIKIESRCPSSWRMLAIVYESAGFVDELLRVLQEWAKASSGDPEPLWRGVEVCSQHGLISQAADFLKQLKSVNPYIANRVALRAGIK